MTNERRPRLIRVTQNTYHCDDIAALHHWLEDCDYRYYGQHDAGEYGRFSHQEALSSDDCLSFIHSYIQVMTSGAIYAPDPYAWQVLDGLLEDDDLRERSV